MKLCLICKIPRQIKPEVLGRWITEMPRRDVLLHSCFWWLTTRHQPQRVLWWRALAQRDQFASLLCIRLLYQHKMLHLVIPMKGERPSSVGFSYLTDLEWNINLTGEACHLYLTLPRSTTTWVKILEPDHTLLFYGIERDTTVHVCTRLLGGVVTIEEYLIDNKDKFLIEVTLTDGRVSLEMTKEGCLFLSTWLKCFTRAFADSKSWNGNFTLGDFKVTNGHVLVITSAKSWLTSSSMNADLVKLVRYIRIIFYKNKLNLISKFPPYFKNLNTFLESMKSPALYPVNRLFIETQICCVESAVKGMLLVWLRRKFNASLTVVLLFFPGRVQY